MSGPILRNNKPTFNYGNYDPYYAQRYDRFSTVDKRVDALLRLRGSDLFAGKAVLDVGCNCGFVAFLVAALGATRVEGVDIDLTLISRALRHLRRLKAEKYRNLPAVSEHSNTNDKIPRALVQSRGVVSYISKFLLRPTYDKSPMLAPAMAPWSAPAVAGSAAAAAFCSTSPLLSIPTAGTPTGAAAGPIPASLPQGPANTEAGLAALMVATATSAVGSLAMTHDPAGGRFTSESVETTQAARHSGTFQHVVPPAPVAPPDISGSDVYSSLPVGPGATLLSDPESGEVASNLEFPYNLEFRSDNFLFSTVEEGRGRMFDVVLCLKLTKWVHLYWGDEGIKVLFQKCFRLLRPGGILILEAQEWTSYQSLKHLTQQAKQNKSLLQLKPQEFTTYLVQVVGFAMPEVVGTCPPLKRPLLLFRRPVDGQGTPGADRAAGFGERPAAAAALAELTDTVPAVAAPGAMQAKGNVHPSTMLELPEAVPAAPQLAAPTQGMATAASVDADAPPRTTIVVGPAAPTATVAATTSESTAAGTTQTSEEGAEGGEGPAAKRPRTFGTM